MFLCKSSINRIGKLSVKSSKLIRSPSLCSSSSRLLCKPEGKSEFQQKRNLMILNPTGKYIRSKNVAPPVSVPKEDKVAQLKTILENLHSQEAGTTKAAHQAATILKAAQPNEAAARFHSEAADLEEVMAVPRVFNDLSDEEAQKQAITEMKEKFEENDEIPVVAVPNEAKVAATSEDLSERVASKPNEPIEKVIIEKILTNAKPPVIPSSEDAIVDNPLVNRVIKAQSGKFYMSISNAEEEMDSEMEESSSSSSSSDSESSSSEDEDEKLPVNKASIPGVAITRLGRQKLDKNLVTVKAHVPLIKFRKWKNVSREVAEKALESLEPSVGKLEMPVVLHNLTNSVPVVHESSELGPTVVHESCEIAPKFKRPEIDELEIEMINSGGAEMVYQ